MCKSGNVAIVKVKIPADLSCDGKEKWKEVGIDSCIAPIVKALQKAGIDMRGSCCGHGEKIGEIALADGRGLLILSKETYEYYLVHESAPKMQDVCAQTQEKSA
jgi:hypothetical protein